MKKPVVELKLPIIPNMELIATQTAEVISRHMNLTDDQNSEISMAIIEACINAFEHSKVENNVFIHFIIEDNGKSVCTDTREAWGSCNLTYENVNNDYVTYYRYDSSKYPHAGSGKRIQF